MPLSPPLSASSYVQYLPAPYHDDPFLARFLSIFENVLEPIERTIDQAPYYYDPYTAPDEFIPWLATWVGVELDENWSQGRRRALVANAARLYRWRGTRHGLHEHLRLYAGRPPLIVENFDGMRLGQDAALGLNAFLGSRKPQTIFITVVVDLREDVDEGVLCRIIEAHKPAHIAYILEIKALQASALPPPATVAPELPSGNGHVHLDDAIDGLAALGEPLGRDGSSS